MCVILGKEIVRSRKAVNKIYASKAQLNSVEMSMKNQLGKLDIKFHLACLFQFKKLSNMRQVFQEDSKLLRNHLKK